MSEGRLTILGLEGRRVLMFVSTVSAAARFAEGEDDNLRERGLVGLEMAGPKNKVAELVSLFIGARTVGSGIPCACGVCDLEMA